MIRASAHTTEFNAGFLVLTSAETDGPVLIHVYDLEHVCLEMEGGLPGATHVLHQCGDSVVETIVFEPPEHMIRLVALAAKDLEKSQKLHFEQSLECARRVQADPDAF